MFDQSVIALIDQRTSVRTYTDQPIETEKRDAISAFMAGHTDNPFGARVRFALVDSDEKKLGTYGVIRGAKTFFAGCLQKGDRDLEGFGFVFEKIVLFAQAQGLGTCWLGGMLNRGSFGKVLDMKSSEYLPAVSPLGYARAKRSLMDQVVVISAGARKRKPFGELFFDETWGNPLDIADSDIKTCLEMVRKGPSASNKQPWRVIRKNGKYHFYLAEDRKYIGNTRFGFCMQRIDMGIAACHFSLTAKELGVPGEILFEDPKLLSDGEIKAGCQYSFTWG